MLQAYVDHVAERALQLPGEVAALGQALEQHRARGAEREVVFVALARRGDRGGGRRARHQRLHRGNDVA